MTVDLAAQLADYAALARRLSPVLADVERAADLLVERLGAGARIWTFGNGGSAADAQHLAGELTGHFRRDRWPLPAVAIGADAAVTTAIGNDYAFDLVFARPIAALAERGDVVVAFSTSGRSPDVLAAMRAARANGALVLLLTGGDGGAAVGLADLALIVPSSDTARIQEVHTLFVHLISDVIDDWAAA